jgi:uncharacterized protein (DUF1330 family)
MSKIPGIVEAGDPNTFQEIVAKINPDEAALENLGMQKDDDPIIMLNLLRFKPRGDASIYSLYGKEAEPQVKKTGSYILYYGKVITDLDPALEFDDTWDGIVMPLYVRRNSFLELQANPLYQCAIPYRVAGTFARMLYVVGDSDTLLNDTSSITDYFDRKESIPISNGEVYIAELLRFKKDNGRQLFKDYLQKQTPLINTAGATHILSRDAETPIVSEQVWEHLLLTRFPSLDAVLQVYQSAEWNDLKAYRADSLEDCVTVATKAIPLPSAE